MTGILVLGGSGSGAVNGFTMTPGVSGNEVGYILSSFGSVSSNVLPDGNTVTSLFTNTNSGHSTLTIAGFSGDPTTGYLISCTVSSHTLLGSAASYSYSDGSATWVWAFNPFGFANGVATFCTVTT